jgi:photosystem II stability/assembly factor-like uncharacterized protein
VSLVVAAVMLAVPAMARAATWTSGSPHGILGSFAIGHPTDPQTAYIVSFDGAFYATHDRGLHWLPRTHPRASSIVVYAGPPTLLVALAPDGEVMSSTDDGTHWQTIGCCASTIDPLDPTRLLGLDQDNHLQRSTDGGATWAAATMPPLPADGVFLPQFVGGGVALASTISGATYRSADLGATWQLATGVPLGFVTGVSSDPLRAWIGPFRTLDGGATWADAGTGDGCASPVVATSQPLRPWTISCTGVFRSIDGGTTWSLVQGTPAHDFEADPRQLGILADGLAAFALGEDGPWLLEAGQPPVYRATGLPPVLGPLLADPSDPARAFSGSFTTRDGGATWLPEPDPARRLMVRVRDRLLVLNDAVTTQLARGGPLTTLAGTAGAVELIGEPGGRRAWALTLHGILTTSDGVSFRRLRKPLPRSNFRLFPTLPAAAGGSGRTLVVLGARRGHDVIAVSRDAGRTFHVRPAPVLVDRLAVDAVDGRLMVAIDNRRRLHRSRDGGRHFRTVLRGVAALAVDPDRRGHWYAARGTRLFVSTNGGATWRIVASPPGASAIAALSVGAGRLWVSGGTGIFSRSLAEDA